MNRRSGGRISDALYRLALKLAGGIPFPHARTPEQRKAYTAGFRACWLYMRKAQAAREAEEATEREEEERRQ